MAAVTATAPVTGIAGQDYAKKDRPLATPVLADFIADTHDVRPDDLLYALDRPVNFRLFRDCSGPNRLNFSLTLRESFRQRPDLKGKR